MYLANLTPLHQPPIRPSLRPPKEPPQRSEAIEAEQARLVQERRELEREQQRVATRAEVTALAEQVAGDFRRALDINRPAYMASMISKAAAKGRGEAVELPRLTGLAAQIILQGRIRRGEAVADAVMLPENETARAVVLSAKRARGDATAAEESWLSNFLKRIER
jgi:hypothetical protein